MVSLHTPLCNFGWNAPDFDLPGVDGKRYRLADVTGPNGLLVMFICNHCPYVKAVRSRIVHDAKELLQQGIHCVAINANDAALYPEDDFAQMKIIAQDWALPFPYLHDASQEVAKAYGAVCTPDFFGFNKHLELQYRGRLDASRKDTAPEGAERDLFQAMLQVAQTGQGPKEQIPSIGCSIKWREG